MVQSLMPGPATPCKVAEAVGLGELDAAPSANIEIPRKEKIFLIACTELRKLKRGGPYNGAYPSVVTAAVLGLVPKAAPSGSPARMWSGKPGK